MTQNINHIWHNIFKHQEKNNISLSISFFAKQKGSEGKTLTTQDKLQYENSNEAFLFRDAKIEKKIQFYLDSNTIQFCSNSSHK